MNSINQTAHPVPDGVRAGEASMGEVSMAASLGDAAHATSDYVHAWSTLLASETRLAGISAVRLVFAALVVPAIALGICITVDALIATLIQRWLHDWASSIAMVLCLDLAFLFGLLVAIRQWWRNLSLPRSRDALAQLLGRLT